MQSARTESSVMSNPLRIARGVAPAWNQAGHSQPLQQEATVQLQQASLQTALADRECVQQAQGLQAHRHPIRQTGTELLVLCLSGCQPRMVDLMSLDPSDIGPEKGDPQWRQPN